MRIASHGNAPKVLINRPISNRQGVALRLRSQRAAVLILRRQFLPEPCHRAIEVLQVESVDPGDPIIFAPAIRRAVGAASEKHGPLQRKAVLARAAELRGDGPAAGLSHSRSKTSGPMLRLAIS
jgi:hypothetical protein